MPTMNVRVKSIWLCQKRSLDYALGHVLVPQPRARCSLTSRASHKRGLTLLARVIHTRRPEGWTRLASAGTGPRAPGCSTSQGDHHERSCTSILRVIPSPAHQVQYPHFTTCVRGLCRGITPLFLSADVPGTPLALRHAALCLAKRVSRRGAEVIQTSAATAQALQRPEAVSWSHPQAPLCRL